MTAPRPPRRPWPRLDVLDISDWHAFAREHPRGWEWLTARALTKELRALQSVECELHAFTARRRLRELERWASAQSRRGARPVTVGLDPQTAVRRLLQQVRHDLDAVLPQAQRELLLPVALLEEWWVRLTMAEVLSEQL